MILPLEIIKIDNSGDASVNIIFGKLYICDTIKQNESEVKKYDFCFFGIFYKDIV